MLRLFTESNEATGGPSEQQAEPQSAKMLIFLQNGEQRLITFTLPKESCTLQEVLEQACIINKRFCIDLGQFKYLNFIIHLILYFRLMFPSRKTLIYNVCKTLVVK